MNAREHINPNTPKRKHPASNTQRSEFFPSTNSPVDQILHLQRTIGNRAVQRLIKSGAIQAKLTIGQPHDKYERDTDRVADQIMRMSKPNINRQEDKEEGIQTKPLADQIAPLVQRQTEPEEEQEPVPIKANPDKTPAVTPGLTSRINSRKGGGQPLVLQRKKEVHVNLRVKQKVKFYEKEGSEQVFSPVSAGKDNLTSKLIKTPTTTYPIIKRADPLKKLGNWGLIYFAAFSGGIGFHSNICYPLRRTLCNEGFKKYCKPTEDLVKRTKHTLKVDGNPRSHGCVRMFDSDAATLFGLVDNGTPVRVYKRQKWRRPLWEGKPKK